MKRLAGKTAIVTGASKGIGAGIARELARQGARVVVNYASDRNGADKVVAAIEAEGGQGMAVQASVAIAADVKRLFAETTHAYGELDILVNNAAVYGPAPLAAITIDEFHRQFNTNVLGSSRPFRQRRITSANPEEPSSISAPSTAVVPYREWQSTPQPKVPWML